MNEFGKKKMNDIWEKRNWKLGRKGAENYNNLTVGN